jgi:hypothetical protein
MDPCARQRDFGNGAISASTNGRQIDSRAAGALSKFRNQGKEIFQLRFSVCHLSSPETTSGGNSVISPWQMTNLNWKTEDPILRQNSAC